MLAGCQVTCHQCANEAGFGNVLLLREFPLTRGWAMRVAIMIALMMGSVGFTAAAEPDKPELARKAEAILRANCYQCHGQDGVFEGGMNYILDATKMIARKKIVPGKPEESKLYLRVAKGTMPPADHEPRPSTAEKELLRQWIAAGAPAAHDNADSTRTIITQADLFGWMLKDLETFDRRSRRFIRYFSLAHLYNQGLSDDELQTYRNALSKLANSLSWRPKISIPHAVDPHKTLLRIDLRWYTWDATLWNRLLAEYPYGILDDSATSRAVLVGTATKLPLLRADWFIANACRPPLYFDLLQLPASIAELERQLRVDAALDIQQDRVARAGFNGSGVSKNNRILERHVSIHGAYWRTYDFDAVPQNLVERAGVLPDQRNIFAYPLGPAGVAPRDPFLHAGGEAIFNLPNGLHGYMIVNAVGNRVDKGAVQIVSDPKRPDRAVETGVSCMSCHLTGINEKADQVRDFVAKNPKAFSRADAEIIRALYPPEANMKKLMDEDQEKYRKAVEQTGAKVIKTEPVSTLTLRYEADLDLPTAAAEVGFTPAEFREKISHSELLTRNLGGLRSDGGTVSRQVFIQAFGDIVRDLKLGALFASNINGGTLPDNTGDLDPLEGSANQANAVAISRDGKVALIAGADRSLKLWDISAEREIRRFVGHTASVWSVAFSPDERQALSGSMDGTARLWDVATGQELKRFEGHLSLVTAVAFSPDGRQILTGGYDGSVALWDAKGEEIKRFEGLSKSIHALTFSPNGKSALIGGDGPIHLIDLDSGKTIKTFAGHPSAVSCVAISPHGGLAASGGDDGTARVWDMGSGKQIRAFSSDNHAAIRDVAFAPSGKSLLTASTDRSVRLWDIDGNNQAGRFDRHETAVITASFINGGAQTMSASRDSAIKAWGLSKHKHLVLASIATNAQTSAPPPKSSLAAALKPMATLPADGTIGNMVLSPNKKWLYYINRTTDKLIQVDAASLKQTRDWPMPSGGDVFTLTPDGKAIYTFGFDEGQCTIIELDPILLKARKKLKADLNPYDIAASDTGLVFLSGSLGGWSDVAVVDWKIQKVVGRWGGVWTNSFVRFSPDPSRLYVATQGVNPGKIEGFPIPVRLSDKPAASTTPTTGDVPASGQFMLTPDGKFLISHTGATFRLGSSRESDLQPGPKLPPHLAAAVDSEHGVLLLLANDGATIKRFSYPAMEWQSNDRLSVLAHQMVYDDQSGRLYVGVINPASLGRPRAKGFGDLQVYEMKGAAPAK